MGGTRRPPLKKPINPRSRQPKGRPKPASGLDLRRTQGGNRKLKFGEGHEAVIENTFGATYLPPKKGAVKYR
ncbi:MAG: hypothetical protein V1493_02570 [Candidatus Diapherotrites archaeon]